MGAGSLTDDKDNSVAEVASLVDDIAEIVIGKNERSHLVVKEQDVQRAILDFLDAKGVTHWRCNLGGVRRSGIGMTKNPMKGFPDIAGVMPGGDGRLFGIEVKRPRDSARLSPEQIAWRDKLTKSGAVHVIATSVEDVKRALWPGAYGAHNCPALTSTNIGANSAI